MFGSFIFQALNISNYFFGSLQIQDIESRLSSRLITA